MKYEIVRLQQRPGLISQASRWFEHTFGIPEEVYRASMEQCLQGGAVPQWYMAMDQGEILGGLGVIENDFHDRPDLTPNVCAVYVDEPYRKQGIAGALLRLVCADMAKLGVETLYLVTSHTSFYERYGWEFFCMVNTESGPSRMYRHSVSQENSAQKISLCGDNCLQCPRYQSKTLEEWKTAAELWHRVGWRDTVLPPEEMRCEGCSLDKPCGYGLTDCVKSRGISQCGQCGAFPCEKVQAMLEKSQAGQEMCREVCTAEEYAQLERAFFHKEENLRK